MITNEQLAEIKDYCAKATAGPWSPWPHTRHSNLSANGLPIKNADGLHVCSLSRHADKPYNQKEADAAFIAQARTDLPLLVAEVERLSLIAADRNEWQDVAQKVSSQRDQLESDLSAAQKRIEDAKELLKKARYYQTADSFDKLEAALTTPPQ